MRCKLYTYTHCTVYSVHLKLVTYTRAMIRNWSKNYSIFHFFFIVVVCDPNLTLRTTTAYNIIHKQKHIAIYTYKHICICPTYIHIQYYYTRVSYCFEFTDKKNTVALVASCSLHTSITTCEHLECYCHHCESIGR